MILTDNRDIEINFTNAIDGFVFDQMDKRLPKFHGLARMRRVDLIVDMPEYVVYIEIKDPEHPKAQKRDVEKLLKKLEEGTLAISFANKLIDSFVYGWAERKAEKPIRYYSIVTLDNELVVHLSDEIEKILPPLGVPITRWKRAFLEHCQVFNLHLWNECFPDWPARRISDSGGSK